MKERLLWKVLLYIFSILYVIYLLLPFYWTFLSSIKFQHDLYTYLPEFWVTHPTFDRYLSILTGQEQYMASPGQIVAGETLKAFKYGLFNSLTVAATTTLLCLVIGGLAAYPYARFFRLRFKGGGVIYALILFLRSIPSATLVVPLYLLIRGINLYDTKAGLVLMYTSFTLPFVFLLLKSFFDTIPVEVIDSARVDGCSELGIFFRIIVPLSLPGFVASGLLAFIMSYQEFLFALVATSSLESKTIPLVVAEFFGRHGMDYGMICTGAILGIVPPLIIALVAQKYIIAGLTAGVGKI